MRPLTQQEAGAVVQALAVVEVNPEMQKTSSSRGIPR